MRYFFAILSGFLLATAGYLGLLFWSAGTPATASAAAIQAWVDHKVDIANAAPSPRLLIVAGSNALYGIRASQLETELGFPVINFGTHAALSLDYHLSKVRKVARPGDTILLALEYELYGDAPVNHVLSDYVFGGDPEYITTLPPGDQLIWLAGASSNVIFRPFVDLVSTAPRERLETRRTHREGLDAHGDFLENSADRQIDRHRDAVAAARPLHRLLGPKRIREAPGWARIASFADWCRAHDIRLLATFPATIDFAVYHERRSRQAQAAAVEGYAALGIPTIGTPADFFYPSSHFFDTGYHLDADGADLRTEMLAEKLRPILATPPD